MPKRPRLELSSSGAPEPKRPRIDITNFNLVMMLHHHHVLCRNLETQIQALFRARNMSQDFIRQYSNIK